jgi:replicative DNA helicase
LPGGEPNDLPPSWDKLNRVAAEAKSWLDRIYVLECGPAITIKQIEAQIADLRTHSQTEQMMIVIDDCQRLDGANQAWDVRLQIVAEQLQQTALKFNLPVLAVWPDLESGHAAPAQKWAEKTASPDVVLVMDRDLTRRQPMNELSQAIILHVVKNRGGEKGRLAYDFVAAFAAFTETP